MASTTAGFTTNLDSSIPDNKWEVVLTLTQGQSCPTARTP